jgi:hypothetical protein
VKARAEVLFTGFLVLVIVTFLVTAIGYNPVARRMPLIVGVFALASALVHLTTGLTKTLGRMASADQGNDGALRWQDAAVCLWLLVLVVVVYLFGVVVGTGLLTVGFYRFVARRPWTGALLFGAVVAGVLWLTFVRMLAVSLHSGLLFEVLLR